MKCPKCGGRGFVDNPQYYQYANCYAYERGIHPTKQCKECGGSGWKIGNYDDILKILCVAVNCKRGIPAKETKEIYDLIKKYNIPQK